MFPPAHNLKKSRKALRDEHIRPGFVTLWLGILVACLLLGSVVRDDPVLRQAIAQGERGNFTLTVQTSELGSCLVPDLEYPIKFNDRTITTQGTSFTPDNEITPGSYRISISMPDGPKVKVSKVVVGTSEEDKKTYAADASGIATVLLDQKTLAGDPTVVVYLSGLCDATSQDEEKKVFLFLKSVQCEKESYKDYAINFSGQILTIKSGLAPMVPLNNGRHRISLSVPNYPEAKIYFLTFLRPNGEVYVARDADITGEVEGVILEDDLWDGASGNVLPSLYLYTREDCEQLYEPPPQRADGPPQIKVAVVKGTDKVTIFKDENPEVEVQAKRDTLIEDGQVIYARPGARVELVASDKRLFIIGGKSVVKFNIKQNPDKTWSVTTDIRATRQFEVRHVEYRKGDRGFVWKIVTPTAVITEKGTIYSVTYDEDSKVTTVAAEQGEVRVTPTNTTLAPFALKGRQMADVSAAEVSPVTSFRNAGEPAGDRGGSLFGDNLLWVGVGIGGLLGLLLLSLLVFLIYRLLNPKPVQLVSQPSAKRAHPTPGVAAQMRRCPNPRCGKLRPSHKKFCSACGRSLL